MLKASSHPGFLKAIAQAENNKNIPSGGWDKERERWFPHKSLEGGTDTIGYGYKLTEAEQAARRIDRTGLRDRDIYFSGLTDEEALELLIQILDLKESRVQIEWNRFHEARPYTGLPLRYRCVLTNLAYNTGSLIRNGKWAWPNLSKAILSNDAAEVRKRMVTTYFDPKLGKRVRLTERAKLIADALEI